MPKTNESRCPILVVRNYPPPPQHIRLALSSLVEKQKQENDPLHPLYVQDPAKKRLGYYYNQDTACSVEPLDGSDRRPYSSPVNSRQHHSNCPSTPRNRILQVRVRRLTTVDMTHLVKPKSPTNRDWTMQHTYAEMWTQRGWTDSERMWGRTDNETPASLHNPTATLCRILETTPELTDPCRDHRRSTDTWSRPSRVFT